ncbi:uncharacterized protein [Montipora capricornis]
MDIKHPAGFIINDACQGQSKKYGTNCKTLVCMAGFWSKGVQDLQHQGVPMTVIAHLFEQALEVCEDVLQGMSLPLTEALQNHISVKTFGGEIVDTDTTSVFQSSVLDDDDETAASAVVDDCVKDDGDVSWYFDGVDDHISGCNGHIAWNNFQFPEVDKGTSIPQTTRLVPVVESGSSVASFKSFQQEMESFKTGEDFSAVIGRTRDVTDGKKEHKTRMFGPNRKSDGGVIDHVPQFAVSSLVSMKLEGHSSWSGKIVHGEGEEEEEEFEASFLDAFTSYTKEKEDPCHQGILFEKQTSKKESLHDTVRKNKLSSVFVQERDDDTKNVISETTVCYKTDTFKSSLGKIMKPKDLSSSHDNEKEVTDKLLSSLSEKLKPKNKEARREARLSEIFKGSRHLVKTPNKVMTATGSLLCQTPLSTHDHTSDICHKEGYRRTGISQSDLLDSSFTKTTLAEKLEPCYTSKTSSKDRKTSGQAENPNLESTLLGAEGRIRFRDRRRFLPSRTKETTSDLTSASVLEKTSSTDMTDRYSIVFQSKDDTKLMDRNLQVLSKLGKFLSHGKEQEMNLAIEVVKNLFRCSGKTVLEEFNICLNMIHAELIHGPPSSFSRVINGLLLENTSDSQSKATRRNSCDTKGQRLIALVNGDVTKSFRHAGLYEELHMYKIIDSKKEFEESVLFNQENDWCHRITGTLADLNIGVLIAKGTVEVSIIDFCLSYNIIVLQNVVYSKLQLLSFATGAKLVTYVTDLREQDVGGPVTIETWESGWAPSTVRRRKETVVGDGVKRCRYVVVRDEIRDKSGDEDFISPLQTVLLCGPSENLLDTAEERFWNSIYRVRNALHGDRVLPGAGSPEIACIRRLNELAAEQHESGNALHPLPGWLGENVDLFRPFVYSVFAEGFKAFLASVISNSRMFTNPHGVSTYVENLVNKELPLDFHQRSCYKIFENSYNELGVIAQVLHPLARLHNTNLPTQENMQSFLENLDDGVACESLSHEAENFVWDDYVAKKAAWKRAVGIVKILLHSDRLVQTGLHNTENEADLL